MDNKIAYAFDRAAHSYDQAAQLQQIVAQKLVASAVATNPETILDIGCGTGIVSTLAAEKYPRAHIAGIDTSPAMLALARQKTPRLITRQTDATDLKCDQKFDLIFSSMLLHWLPQPDQILRHWQSLLAPGGTLHVALPVAGSLSEWRDLCRAHNITDGLWHFPAADFAYSANQHLERETIIYENLSGFFDSLKQTGAHASRPDHKPLTIRQLRKLIAKQTDRFEASYKIKYLAIPR